MKKIHLLIVLIFIALSCQKLEIPDPDVIDPMDDSTFFLDFSLNNDGSSFRIGYDDVVITPSYTIENNLLRFTSTINKGPNCVNNCAEQLKITIGDVETLIENAFDVESSLEVGTYKFATPDVEESSLIIRNHFNTNKNIDFESFTFIDNLGPFQNNQEIIISDVDSSFSYFPETSIPVWTINTDPDNLDFNIQSICVIHEIGPSSHSDIEVALYTPDSTHFTITATPGSSSIIQAGEFDYTIDSTSFSKDWETPLVLEIRESIGQILVSLSTINEFSESQSTILLEKISNNTVEQQYSSLSIDNEFITTSQPSDIRSRVIVDYTDPNGIDYSSKLITQQPISDFQILSVEPYSLEYEGQKTLKLEISFNVLLSDIQGNTIEMADAKGTIVVAYPEY